MPKGWLTWWRETKVFFWYIRCDSSYNHRFLPHLFLLQIMWRRSWPIRKHPVPISLLVGFLTLFGLIWILVVQLPYPFNFHFIYYPLRWWFQLSLMKVIGSRIQIFYLLCSLQVFTRLVSLEVLTAPPNFYSHMGSKLPSSAEQLNNPDQDDGT